MSTLALLVALGAVLLGAAVHGELSEQAHDRVPVQVVVTEDVPLVASGGSAEEIPAQVRWTGSDGVERTGLAPVKGPKRAGAAAVVWTTRDGQLVHPPMAPAEVAAAAILGSVLAGIVGPWSSPAWRTSPGSGLLRYTPRSGSASGHGSDRNGPITPGTPRSSSADVFETKDMPWLHGTAS